MKLMPLRHTTDLAEIRHRSRLHIIPLNNCDFNEDRFRRGHIPTELREWNYAYIFCNVDPNARLQIIR
jgi:hypothetical protein